jgi:hypothetical protein
MPNRRSLIRGLALLGGAVGLASGRPASANPGGSARLENLYNLPPTPNPVWVEDQGFFAAVPRAGEPDGVVRIAGPGDWDWLRVGFSGTVRPQWFARGGDGGDDALAIQRACDYTASGRTGEVDLGNLRYKCRSRIEIDPTRTAIVGSGALLDFSDYRPPAAGDRVVATLDSVLPDGDWERDGAALVHSDGPETGLKYFVTLPEKGRYRVDVRYGRIEGSGQLPFSRLSLSTSDGTLLARHTSTAAGRYIFEFVAEQPVARLTLESDADVRLEALTVTWIGQRECILVRSLEDSPRSGHKWMEGVEIAGPGGDTILDGIRFETLHEVRSSRIEMRNVNLHGFDTGMVFSHRSYMCRFYGVRCVSRVSAHFLGAVRDAGESLSFYGCILGGGETAILNNGVEVIVTASSLNFCRQVFVGTGTLTLQGCHIELHRPTDARPFFDIGGGHTMISGGVFLISGHEFELGNQCEHIFALRSKRASALMSDVTCYNLRTQSNALAGGAGRLETVRLAGGRPRHVAPIVQFLPERNLFGPVPWDIRQSEGIDGKLVPLAMEGDTLRVEPTLDHLWLVGLSQRGAELGLAFEARAEDEAELEIRIFGLRGEERLQLDRRWLAFFEHEWRHYARSTGESHGSAQTDGRAPDGYDRIAVHLDLSRVSKPMEIRHPFLSAG